PPLECSSTEQGSIIECATQVHGESVPVAGTGLTLNQRRMRGVDGPSYRLKAKLSNDDDGPESLLKMRTYAEVAGQRLEAEYDPDEWLTHEFVWDGKDVYGRQVQGAMPIEVCVSYVYPMQYTTIFGASGSVSGSKFGYK